MATSLPSLTASSTAVKHSRILPDRNLVLDHHRRNLLLRLDYPLISSSSFRALASSSPSVRPIRIQSLLHSQSRRSSSSLSSHPPPQLQFGSSSRQISVTCSASSGKLRGAQGEEIGAEEVFFDGGVHFGDLLVNLLFGFTLVWLPLTITAVFRNLFLRYRFTNLRVTVQSGLLGGNRKDFSYDVVKDVKLVPRFIGEWGDMAIELKDGTKVEIRCVPKFREIAAYVQERAGTPGKPSALSSSSSSPARGGGTRKKGFS